MDPSGNDFVHFALSVLGTQKDERSNLRWTSDTIRLRVEGKVGVERQINKHIIVDHFYLHFALELGSSGNFL